MTQGVLMFAFDNEAIDYVALARWSTERIHRHLDLPVCLITDRMVTDGTFDQVVHVERRSSDSRRHFEDIDRPVTWYNQDRASAYEFSPWDVTLLLDADYVVASDQLHRIMQQDATFLCHRLAYDVTASQGYLDGLNWFGQYRLPMYWATVIKFTKDQGSRMIFDCMKMVRDNWSHYRHLYSLGRSAFRNDFALSISLGIVHGHVSKKPAIPWHMACVMPTHDITMTDLDQFQITWMDSASRSRRTQLTGMDFHAMAKGQLGAIVANYS